MNRINTSLIMSTMGSNWKCINCFLLHVLNETVF